ncbi:uncharacterized protein [Phyllobates terribilis]|uniref:uncharacterized protein n=1 Tax=Phyllobates terribilis TaxID=111132 RepID=UPI003CCAF8E3
MGAKLSKKKKGYCLGAGKDGESTETTEVEQKETETQLGQKDAAEPNGEKTPTDKTQNNGSSEEKRAPVEKNSMEDPSGKTTKDDTNKDQKSEGKPNAEQKKVEEPKQEQDKPENTKSSSTSQQTAPESGKEEKSQPVEKPQTDPEKAKELLAKEEPTLEAKAVTTLASSEPKRQSQSVIEPSAPVAEHEEELAKSVPDPETKVEVEKMEKEQTPVLTKDQVLEQAKKEQTPVLDSVKGAEIPEIVESLVSETVLVDPVLQEPVAEVVEPEPAQKVMEPEPELALPEAVPDVELVKPEPVTELVKSKISEEPVALVPVIKIVEPVANPELVPCSEPEKLSETRQETESLTEPLPSNEVPDSTVKVEEIVENHETLSNSDLVTESIETQAFPTESVPAEQPSVEKVPHQDVTVADKGPSEKAVEEIHESKVQDMITTTQEVGDKEIQNEVKEEEKESVSNKEPTEQGSLEKKIPVEEVLDTSKDDKEPEGTIIHDGTPDKNAEANAENHKMPPEELSNEPSAPLIIEKHGVGNGLPLKEEVKVHLENGCDKDLHEFNGQGEGHEIAVCNE